MSNKFNAKKVIIDGIKFDSTKEGNYYKRLKLQQKAVNPAERVVDIKLQVRYDIVVNEKKICFYKLDFQVTYADGRKEYVDVKGHKKGAAYQNFRLKKKLVEALYNISITEV